MTVSYVEYDLQDCYLMNWLAAGPQAISTQEVSITKTPADLQQAMVNLLDVKTNITNSAVERGPLDEGNFVIDGYQGEWNYYRCQEDHLVDLSTVFPTPHFVRAWAFTLLSSQVEQQVQFFLTTFGPIEVWINKKSVFQSANFSQQPLTLAFEAPIKKGVNRILITFAGLAAAASELAVGLKLVGDTSQFHVRIPTLIPSIDRRNELESVLEKIYLDRDVFDSGDRIGLNWPADLKKQAFNDARLQTLSGRIYGQAEDQGKPGQKLILGTSVSLAQGPYQVFVMPRSWEYYESQIRITKKIDLWIMGNNRFSSSPYGNLEERRIEALRNAASRENQVFAEIAKLALGKWASVNAAVLTNALDRIRNGELGSEIFLLGLLGAVIRYSSQPGFPQELLKQVSEVALNYQYTPGQEMVDRTGATTQDHEILLDTCQILAGQLDPDAIFSHDQLPGAQQRSRGETRAVKLMRELGAKGFSDWDSRFRYANTLIALSYLVDLAETEEVWELASVLMDKLLFTIALNSFNGVFGSTQGYAAATGDLKSGLLDPISGITRLMWGMGIYNHHIDGTVSLACLKNYDLPPIIAEIAAKPPSEMLNREQQGPTNKITYRTPNYMLCSAQDYQPGQPGKREHLWQATLGPQAIVFTNHPGRSTESDAHTPNFWLGNGVLPRVAQWKDTLISLYKLPGDAIMKFTHAYFPTYEFDEFLLRDNTAFARKGEGYLALTSPSGIRLTEVGSKALRELRSFGEATIWICQMGQSSTDGTFDEFQEKVLGLNLVINDLDIQLQTLRGDDLRFGWESPFSVNGEIQPLSGYKHYDNPYTSVDLPCNEMEITNGEYLLRLKFGDMPQD